MSQFILQKSNSGRTENSILWALSPPNLFFLHMLPSHPFKHLYSCWTKNEKRKRKKLQLQVESHLAALGALCVTQEWGQPGCQPCHHSTAMAPLTAGPAQCADTLSSCTLPHWLGLLQHRNNCWLYSGQRFRGGIFPLGKLWPVIMQQYK